MRNRLLLQTSAVRRRCTTESGDYAQPVTHQAPAPSSASDPAFAWGDAAVGAGVALGLVLLAAVLYSVVGAGRARSGRELAASGAGGAPAK